MESDDKKALFMSFVVALVCIVLSGFLIRSVVSPNHEPHDGSVIIECYEDSVKTIGNRTWCEIVEQED